MLGRECHGDMPEVIWAACVRVVRCAVSASVKLLPGQRVTWPELDLREQGNHSRFTAGGPIQPSRLDGLPAGEALPAPALMSRAIKDVSYFTLSIGRKPLLALGILHSHAEIILIK